MNRTDNITKIRIKELSRWFGSHPGLKQLDLTLTDKTHLGVIGPNGAGKTTLLRMISGHLAPTTGAVLFEQQNEVPASTIPSRIGFVGHESMLYDSLSPAENLQFFGNLYRVNKLHERLNMLLKRLNLWDRRDSPVSTLSKGMTKKLSICRALLPQPDIFVLDEPFYGLDQKSQRIIEETIQEIGTENSFLFLSSHSLTKIHSLCNEILVLSGAKPLLFKTIDGVSWNEFQSLYQRTINSEHPGESHTDTTG